MAMQNPEPRQYTEDPHQYASAIAASAQYAPTAPEQRGAIHDALDMTDALLNELDHGLDALRKKLDPVMAQERGGPEVVGDLSAKEATSPSATRAFIEERNVHLRALIRRVRTIHEAIEL